MWCHERDAECYKVFSLFKNYLNVIVPECLAQGNTDMLLGDAKKTCEAIRAELLK